MTAAYEAPSTVLPRISITFDHRGDRYTVMYGRFDDGRPAEIFLSGRYLFDIALKMASMALQHGVSIKAVRGVLIGSGGPMGKAIDLIIAACPGPIPTTPPARRP